jgi:hypothetical protein
VNIYIVIKSYVKCLNVLLRVKDKGKVVPVLNYLSNTPWRHGVEEV